MSHESELKGRWATAGAIVAAVVASSCCILPVIFGAAGISTLALAGVFASARPYMLVLTGVLLGVGFYYNYLRKPDCAPGEACVTPRPGFRRMNRSILWVATLAVVAFALFPSYAYVFSGSETPAVAHFESIDFRQVVLEVSGMTCEACTVSVQNELAAVPGVIRSRVDFLAGQATVLIEADAPPSTNDLLSAVGRAGYSAVVASSGARSGAGGEG